MVINCSTQSDTILSGWWRNMQSNHHEMREQKNGCLHRSRRTSVARTIYEAGAIWSVMKRARIIAGLCHNNDIWTSLDGRLSTNGRSVAICWPLKTSWMCNACILHVTCIRTGTSTVQIVSDEIQLLRITLQYNIALYVKDKQAKLYLSRTHYSLVSSWCNHSMLVLNFPR